MIETVAALRFEQRDGPMAGPLALVRYAPLQRLTPLTQPLNALPTTDADLG